MPLDIRRWRLPKRQPLAILSALLLSAACSRPPAAEGAGAPEAAGPGAAAAGVTAAGAAAPDGVPAATGAVPVPPAADATASTPARPTEAALRGHIASIQRGTPDDERLTPELAAAVRAPR